MKVIVSDLEGTLTTGSSCKGLRTYFKANYNSRDYNLFFLRWLPRYLKVKLGILSRRKVMFLWMQEEILFFRGLSPGEFYKIAGWVVDHVLWPQRRLGLLTELEAYRQEGVKIIISSSAYQPIVDLFAQKISADAIGSAILFSQEKLTGVALPINAYEYKPRFIQERFNTACIEAAYGDTGSDIPMMEMSRNPVAVFPDKELQQMAETRGWRIIEN